MSESWFCSEAKHDCWISLPQAPFPECGRWTSLTLQKEVCGSGVQGHETQVLMWVGWPSENKHLPSGSATPSGSGS